MKNVGFIGWRGMVGSVLMQRMVEERDFDAIRPVFFSTSQLGQAAPSFGGTTGTLQDAFDLEALKALDIIVTCQGGDYTNEIYPKLRESGWQGYWIDAASSLRMKDNAIIILDPVNQDSGIAEIVAVLVKALKRRSPQTKVVVASDKHLMPVRQIAEPFHKVQRLRLGPHHREVPGMHNHIALRQIRQQPVHIVSVRNVNYSHIPWSLNITLTFRRASAEPLLMRFYSR